MTTPTNYFLKVFALFSFLLIGFFATAQEQKEVKEPKEEKNDRYYFREIYLALHVKEEAKFEKLKKEVFEKIKFNEESLLGK